MHSDNIVEMRPQHKWWLLPSAAAGFLLCAFMLVNGGNLQVEARMFPDNPALERQILWWGALFLASGTLWLMVIGVLGYPRLTMSDKAISMKMLPGKGREYDLATLGTPHPRWESAVGPDRPRILFYSADREAALKAAGVHEPPSDSTAQVLLEMRFLAPTRDRLNEICEAIAQHQNSIERVAGEGVSVQSHLNAHNLRRNLIAPLGILFGAAALFVGDGLTNGYLNDPRAAATLGTIALISGVYSVIYARSNPTRQAMLEKASFVALAAAVVGVAVWLGVVFIPR